MALAQRKFRLSGSLLSVFLSSVVVFTCGLGRVVAEPIGWMERFALADDRDAALAELIPGTDDYYFYHCLHYQTQGQLERSEVILRDWIAEHKGRQTPTITAMLDRQRLLNYGNAPQQTIDYLVARLGIKLDHAPPATKNQRRYPSRLNSQSLAARAIVDEALRRNDPLKPRGIQLLAQRFLQRDTAGIPIQLKELLNRVDGPYLDQLDRLVIREIQSRRQNERRFGDLAAHRFLTLDQLREVAKSLPQVADDNQYVAAVLRRMRPDADHDPSQQDDVRYDYLTRIESYVQTLPASYNSLKASAAFRLLEANLQRGKYDRELFIRYLQLPRVSPIIHPEWARRGGVRVNLNDDFLDLALLPPIHDEQSIVRAHLEHFLKDAPDPNAFGQYLQPEYLRRIFAETKLLYGVGDESQWYRMLTTAARKQIRDAVELRLATDQPKTFQVDEPTELHVDLKNVDELIVRIYEINTQSYYRSHDKPIDTDLDLDGLVATHEHRFAYHSPAIRRHRETIELEEIDGRGVWIVDLVGKGLRARALIRRGHLDHIDSYSADGMVFTIIDEARKPVPTATMWVGSRQFAADDEGRIVIPPVAEDVQRRAILSDGHIAVPLRFRHLRESYQLQAAMHLDRGLLKSGGMTELLIRPRLMMGATIVDPGMLKDVSVRIEAADLDNVSTTFQIGDVRLDQNREFVVPLRVPARLIHLRATLIGAIDGLADGKEQILQTSRTWDIAGIRRTNHAYDSFLTRDADDFVIEVRGRNGETVSGATVRVVLTTNLRQQPVEQTLQTNELGRVMLGTLTGVSEIRYSVAGGLEHQRDLRLDRTFWPDKLFTIVQRPIRLPLPEAPDRIRSRYRLVELRGGEIHRDQTDRLKVELGMLVIADLAPGDYQLLDRETNRRHLIAVVDGPAIGNVAAGRVRHRSLSPALPLSIASIDRRPGNLRIRVAGNVASARVHIYASRYFDHTSPLDQLALPFPVVRGRRVVLPRSGFVSDLRLGDEYLYVLRRRYAHKYPGVMLPQPGILLNPWETEATTNVTQSAAPGEAPPPSAAAEAEADFESLARQAESKSALVASDFDFLANPGKLLANLRPDQDGWVTISADEIAGLPLIQIIVADPATIVQRTVFDSPSPVETVDLRLANSLDSKKPYTFQRGLVIAGPDEPFDLNQLGTAQIQVYSSVKDLFKLYQTLVNDPRFNEFDELTSWHRLERPEKLQLYARLASHELHLFLRFHDPSFFQETIEPYLRNKKEKQFIDDWLLGNDLTPYTSLWRYQQLNAAERALLAMRVADLRDPILRDLRETVAQQDVDFDEIRLQLETALKSDRFELAEVEALMLGGELDDAQNAKSRNLDVLFGDVTHEGRDLKRARRKLSEQRMDADFFAVPESSRGRGGAMFGGRMSGGMGGGGAFFRNLDSTKQWAESQWDHIRTVGGPPPQSLITPNAFWIDVASRDSDEVKVSPQLLRPVTSRHAALVALAMCGLPLTPGNVELPSDDVAIYRPEHDVAIVTKRLATLQPPESDTSILIGQRFLPLQSSNQGKAEATNELSEFLIGVPYRGQIVVSNPTSARAIVDVFWQLPAGSIPLSASQVTDSRTLTLDPFAVEAIEYQFYFPVPGQFHHYPATVSVEGRLVAQSREKTFSVVAEPTPSDELSWDYIARSGTVEQISQFLQSANLRSLDWDLVAHRMKDPNVYRTVINVLGRARLAIGSLWGYAFFHRDESGMRAYLETRQDLAQRVGPVLKSPLLVVDPIARRMHEMLEYAPLVRARIHRLGEQDEILNATFRQQYQQFVRVLGFIDDIAPEDRLALTYYLLIQNRIHQAIETFSEIDPATVSTKLQYDYMDAYLAMHRKDFDRAQAIASRHAEEPIPRWAQRFTELQSQLRQRQQLNQTEKLVSASSDGSPSPIPEGTGDLSVLDRERRQALAADQQPEVVVRVEGERIRIDHRQTKKAILNFYGVDLELLFSKAPFVREDLQRMAMVRPMRSRLLEFDDATGSVTFDLDRDLIRQTLLVEVVAGAARKTTLFYGGEMTTYVSQAYGQLQTTDSANRRPIDTAYVKVYARYPDGSIRFYKDGYTDSRGRFDYASISAADAQGATEFAILVMSDEKGATLHQVAAPNQ